MGVSARTSVKSVSSTGASRLNFSHHLEAVTHYSPILPHRMLSVRTYYRCTKVPKPLYSRQQHLAGRSPIVWQRTLMLHYPSMPLPNQRASSIVIRWARRVVHLKPRLRMSNSSCVRLTTRSEPRRYILQRGSSSCLDGYYARAWSLTDYISMCFGVDVVIYLRYSVYWTIRDSTTNRNSCYFLTSRILDSSEVHRERTHHIRNKNHSCNLGTDNDRTGSSLHPHS
jgi:hypothetical protein